MWWFDVVLLRMKVAWGHCLLKKVKCGRGVQALGKNL